MFRRFLAASAVAITVAVAAQAQQNTAPQDTVFIQIEARSSLTTAQTSVRRYSGQLENVSGFSLGGGWYGVALGPYTRADAEALLRDLRRTGQVPPDSYIETASSYGQQFWPVGAQAIQPQPIPRAAEPNPAPQSQAQTQTPVPAQTAAPAPAPQPVVDETPRQARASERLLTRDERAELQVALKWAGFYNSTIDAAFGRGTRNAMAAWQKANGIEPTGILTTMQRAELLRQYNAVLDGMNMAPYTDPRAGISIDLPLGAVRFDRFEAPFALFEPTGTVDDARVLLISQPGDRQTMAGLYEIMQTLEIVPRDGNRKRDRNGFVLTGANDRIVSHTEVGLSGGQIKGWTLIWPAGDEERRSRILGMMKSSFERIDGVLDPALVSDDGQQVDLVSGLRVRKPLRTGSGFFVENRGTVLTSAATVSGCGRVTLDDVHDAEISARDDRLGLATLRPQETLAPRGIAAFSAQEPRLQSDIAVAGYSFGGVLTAPTLTFGTLADLRGLAGETSLKRLALTALPGDTGGPVLDASGGVIGVLLPREDGNGRRLPDEVSFASRIDSTLPFLQASGVAVSMSTATGALAPEDLTALATNMTVLVSCWE